MNRLQPLNLYMVLMAVFIAALLLGLLFFIVGINEVSYLVTDGVRYGVRYLDKPRYDQYLQGLIFTGFFLVAGLLFVFVIAVPDDHAPAQRGQMPPQPRRRPPMPIQGQPAPQAAAPQPAAIPTPPPEAPPPAMEAAPEPTPAAPEAAPAAAAPAPAPRPTAASVDEEVLTSASEVDLGITDLPDERMVETGEDDVVYGTGRVTDDSIWDFVLAYPDSAVKFLYRKTLENKALSPTEEDIYRKWELRGMTRAKVRELVLDIMGWRRLPDDFPHNIWRDLRDQIFEMKAR